MARHRHASTKHVDEGVPSPAGSKSDEDPEELPEEAGPSERPEAKLTSDQRNSIISVFDFYDKDKSGFLYAPRPRRLDRNAVSHAPSHLRTLLRFPDALSRARAQRALRDSAADALHGLRGGVRVQ